MISFIWLGRFDIYNNESPYTTGRHPAAGHPGSQQEIPCRPITTQEDCSHIHGGPIENKEPRDSEAEPENNAAGCEPGGCDREGQ